MTARRTGSATLALDGVVITAAGIEAFDCPICEAPRDLVVPDCADDHELCPDRACAECGYALVVGSSPEFEAVPSFPLTRPGHAPCDLTRRAG